MCKPVGHCSVIKHCLTIECTDIRVHLFSAGSSFGANCKCASGMLTGLYSFDSIDTTYSRRRFLAGIWGGTGLMTVTSVIGRVVKPCVRDDICHYYGTLLIQ